MEVIVTGAQWVQDNIALIGGYLGVAAGISVVVQWVKVKFNLDVRCIKWLKLDGPKLINILLTVLTALPFIVDEVLQQFNQDPNLHANYAWLFATAIWVHRFAVSPLYGKLQAYLETKRAVKDKAAAYDQLVATQSRVSAPITTTESTTSSTDTYTDVYDPTADVVQG